MNHRYKIEKLVKQELLFHLHSSEAFEIIWLLKQSSSLSTQILLYYFFASQSAVLPNGDVIPASVQKSY